jgi:hypothetical protein
MSPILWVICLKGQDELLSPLTSHYDYSLIDKSYLIPNSPLTGHDRHI